MLYFFPSRYGFQIVELKEKDDLTCKEKHRPSNPLHPWCVHVTGILLHFLPGPGWLRPDLQEFLFLPKDSGTTNIHDTKKVLIP